MERRTEVGLISPFGPRSAQPKWRKNVPRAAPRTERFFAPVEFTLIKFELPFVTEHHKALVKVEQFALKRSQWPHAFRGQAIK
jgi:hypothetical protein